MSKDIYSPYLNLHLTAQRLPSDRMLAGTCYLWRRFWPSCLDYCPQVLWGSSFPAARWARKWARRGFRSGIRSNCESTTYIAAFTMSSWQCASLASGVPYPADGHQEIMRLDSVIGTESRSLLHFFLEPPAHPAHDSRRLLARVIHAAKLSWCSSDSAWRALSAKTSCESIGFTQTGSKSNWETKGSCWFAVCFCSSI